MRRRGPLRRRRAKRLDLHTRKGRPALPHPDRHAQGALAHRRRQARLLRRLLHVAQQAARLRLAVHKFLAERDLSGFDPSRPPPMTRAKLIVQASQGETDSPLSRAVDRLGDPDGFFLAELFEIAEYGELVRSAAAATGTSAAENRPLMSILQKNMQLTFCSSMRWAMSSCHAHAEMGIHGYGPRACP